MKAIRTVINTFTLATLLCASLAVHATTASDAARQAEQTTGGKVLQVKQNKSGNYQVRVLLPNGQVKNIMVNNDDERDRDNERNERSSERPNYR